MKSKKKRIVRYKRPVNINIGLIIFILIFVYVGFSTIIYLMREKISIYEVVKGQSENTPSIETTGIILRNETVTPATASGYINYYIKEGTKAAVGNTLYSLDESGTVSQMLEEAAENNTTLTNENISEIRNDITDFTTSFNKNNFDMVYDFKYDLSATLLECINLNSLDSINTALQSNGSGAFMIQTAQSSGIVEFYADGFENYTANDVTSDTFSTDKYNKNELKAGTLIESGTPVYKTINSEDWQIIIPITQKQIEEFSDTTYVDVRFPSENLTASAAFSTFQNGNDFFACLSFKRYMIRFADKRFINVQILGVSTGGLKIPKSSIVEKTFYTIPSEYIVSGGDTTENGFQKETYDDSGNPIAVLVTPQIYCTKDDLCYVSTDDFKEGDIIVLQNSDSKFQIGQKGKLNGVYNVNTGYTTFKYVEVLSEKNGYYIVKSGTNYGLQCYDQIVLKASLVKENQVIFH